MKSKSVGDCEFNSQYLTAIALTSQKIKPCFPVCCADIQYCISYITFPQGLPGDIVYFPPTPKSFVGKNKLDIIICRVGDYLHRTYAYMIAAV